MGIDNAQCHQVIFGGSADNGYARLLSPYRGSSKVSLIEGPQFEKELAQLATSFVVFHCLDIFNREKLVTVRPSSHNLTPPGLPPQLNGRATNYATIASTSSAQPAPVPVIDCSVSTLGTIARNSAGQRIDVSIRCSPTDVKALKVKKLCNEFHLLGHCSHEMKHGRCDFLHGTRVTGKMREALRYVARLSACQQLLVCADKNCILGHQCPKEPCRQGNSCFFPSVMHGVDTRIVSYDG
jgi:hypothetical protein